MSRRLLRRCVAAGAVVCLAAGAAAVALHAQIAPGSRVPAATALDDPANAAADFSPRPPVQPLTPEAQVDTFWLPAGYRIEPVLSDPLIQDPAQIVFDGNGRMYVLELRGYFQTPDGIDLIPPEGRISRHEDRDGDGVYEHHSVFIDGLVFPRFVLPFGDGVVLTMETNTNEVWKYTDTDGDGTADTRELFVTDFGRAGTMEMQQSTLLWALDNWMYSTINSFRIRWTPRGILREPTGPNRSQWGVTQDDYGKVYFQGGASGMPGYFQFPVHYGDFAAPDQFEPDLNVLWGAPVLVGDIMQGLPWTRQPDGSIIWATAGAGAQIYRGHRLPDDLVGDYLYGEVVGRIVRRLRPVTSEGLTQLRNVYTRSEFIRSLDPLFRPVYSTTAPDGTIYIADMYRGIIEGAQWAKTGTYLRAKIEQYGLDHIVNGRGRIWRLTSDGLEPDRTRPRMYDQTSDELVAHLAHPNGWWRDTAQQNLVLRQDRSVVAALERMARGEAPAASASAATGADSAAAARTRELARIHALWTLEGLEALEAGLVNELLDDPSPKVRIQAIRASETLYKAGNRSFADRYRSLAADPDVDVVIQAMLTMNVLQVPGAEESVKQAMAANGARGVHFVGNRILNPPDTGLTATTVARTPEEAATLDRGRTIYQETCFTCHGDDGRGTPDPGAPGATVAPSLAGSPRLVGHRDYVVRTILHGLEGPIDGRTYSQVMVPLGANRDEWVADVASYVRNSFGNTGTFVTPADVARVRAATAGRDRMWTVDELVASLPQPLVPDTRWKVTASHEGQPDERRDNHAGGFNFEIRAEGALNFLGWTTGVPQAPGMWLQVELPEPATLV